MGSSSKNRGSGLSAGPAKPQQPTGRVKGPGANGGTQTNKYYTDISQLPPEGGLMRPPSIPGTPDGIGLNWVMPPPPQPRQQLAEAMSPASRNGIYYPNPNYGSAWMEGGRNGEHARGGHW